VITPPQLADSRLSSAGSSAKHSLSCTEIHEAAAVGERIADGAAATYRQLAVHPRADDPGDDLMRWPAADAAAR